MIKTIISYLFVFFVVFAHAQKKQNTIKVSNALIVGLMDKSSERYVIEAALTEIFTSFEIKSLPEVNLLKVGTDPQILASDSIKQVLAAKGIDTYVLVSVRGFDKRFKKSTRTKNLKEILGEGHLFPIYKEDAASVSFEFFFFKNGEYLGTDIIKCGNVSSRDSVLKKFRKKVSKRLEKKWR